MNWAPRSRLRHFLSSRGIGTWEGDQSDERIGLLGPSSPKHLNPRLVELKPVLHNGQQGDGVEPVHVLVEKGTSLELLDRVIESSPGAVHSTTKNGWTPLHFACWRGRIDFVQLLIEKGNADVTVVDKFGWTPFVCAAENGHVEICSYLFQTSGVNFRSALGSIQNLSPNVQKLVMQIEKPT